MEHRLQELICTIALHEETHSKRCLAGCWILSGQVETRIRVPAKECFMSLPDHSKEIAALLNQLIPLDITEMIISYLSEVHLARRCCWQYEVDMQVIRASYGISCGIGRSYAHIVETE